MAKRLLTPREEATNDALRPLCERWGSHVFPKVRVADVLQIENSGVTDSNFRFALQSHFDFLVTDTDIMPLFAVEFDGVTHQTEQQRRRDAQKDGLCERFKFPLLRINSRYLDGKYREMSLLGWFIQSWFANRWIADAQEVGHIPADEPFDAMSLHNLPGENKSFPLWLACEIQDAVRSLAESGLCRDRAISCIVGEDKKRNSHALGFVNLMQGRAIWTRTAMRSQLFPVDTHSVLGDIAVLETYERMCAVISGACEASLGSELDLEIDCFQKQYELRRFSAHAERS